MTTAAVFSVVLSSFVSHERADKRELAGLMIKRAQKTLMGYVSAVPGEAAYMPGTPQVGRWPASATAGWSLRGGGSPGVRHDISSLLIGTDLQVPGVACAWGQTCHFVYYVINQNCGLGTGDTVACKQVIFDIRYAN
ncbi:MAG: hypothetical protein FD189_921 [Elusimicrobia bacterium]|nr:MAG: hypothetical protein FD154_1042 [Elusimicrobiota bacterium]KAF0156576.1 MAG: hypothetical protein FD189_921 [Elusimicrobiota bacterium]